MIDKLFFVVLVLNATSLFAFVAPQAGVTIGTVSLVLLVLNALYLTAKVRYLVPLLMRPVVLAWLFLLVVWPVCTVLYAPEMDVRAIALRLYTFSLFLGAVAYAFSSGLQALHRVIALSLAISLVGMGLSMLRPEYFQGVAELAEKRTEQMGRAFGFFMEPNVLAHSLIYLFVAWFALWKRKNTVWEVPVILAFLLVMLLTGSRTGVAVAVIIVTLIFAYSWRKRLLSGKFALRMCLLVTCLALGVLGLKFYLSNSGDSANRQEFDLSERMETLLSFKLSKDGGLQDVGSLGRLAAQADYWKYVARKPLRGYGLGSNSHLYEKGVFYKSAHSEALTRALEHGILYPLAFGLMMVHLCIRPVRRRVETLLGTNAVCQFVLVLLLLFVVNGDLFDNRTFYVVWALFFAAVYYPRRVFGYDTDTGRLTGYLGRDVGRSSRGGSATPLSPARPKVLRAPESAPRAVSKVLHVVPALSAGGAEGFVTFLGAQMAGLDVEVRVFVLAGVRRERGKQLLARLQEAGVEVTGIEERSPTSLSNLLRLVRLIRSWRPDVVHAHLYAAEVACVCARWLSPGSAARYVRTLHSSNIRGYRSPVVLRQLNRFYHLTVACSASVSKAYLQFMEKEELPRLVTVNNTALMLDALPNAEEKRQAREALGIPASAFVVAHVGRIGGGSGNDLQTEPKAQDTLLKAFAQAFGGDGDKILAIVGDGPLRPEAEALARSLGVEEQVRFLGEQPEPWPALKSADMFCFPSRYEGLPLVLVEAASCGLPIVASDIPEIRPLTPGDAWMLFPVDDVAAFAGGMRRMHEERDRFAALGREAVEGFKERFSMKACAEKYLEAYRLAIGGGRGARDSAHAGLRNTWSGARR